MRLSDAQRDFVAAIQDFCERECGTAEHARLLVYDVAAKVDREPGRALPREASMAKLKASELAVAARWRAYR